MSAAWVAAGVRGRGLLRRRIGRDGATRLASSTSLEAALAELEASPYRREVRRGLDLESAQWAVSATVLWHLRVLAGWGPPLAAGPLRVLAGPFEIANIVGHLARLDGQHPQRAYDLGSLATAWPAVSRARSVAEVRAALRSSPWGDPGTDDLPALRLSLELAWARRAFDGVPGASDWATSTAALVIARVVAAGAGTSLTPAAARDATHLLGPRWQTAGSITALAASLPRAAAKTLEVAADPGDLWLAEVRWCAALDESGAALVARPRPDSATGAGVAAQLEADAWRVRAALAAAAEGGTRAAEVLSGVA